MDLCADARAAASALVDDGTKRNAASRQHIRGDGVRGERQQETDKDIDRDTDRDRNIERESEGRGGGEVGQADRTI